MKFSLVLSLGAGLASALVKRSISVEKYDGEYTLRAADIPADAPEGYMTGIVFTHTEKRSIETLTILPNNVERRHESFQALQRLRGRVAASDFYECANAVCNHSANSPWSLPLPSDAHLPLRTHPPSVPTVVSLSATSWPQAMISSWPQAPAWSSPTGPAWASSALSAPH